MRYGLPWLTGISLCMAGNALGQNCEGVIALSRGVDVVVEDRESIEQNSANFCDAFSRGESFSDSVALGASYEFLSGTLDISNASIQDVASRYCSGADGAVARRHAFRRYVDMIDPRAYVAYEQCLQMSAQELRFDVNRNSILPNEFSMRASFVSSSTGQASAYASYSSSSGVECTWDGVDGKVREIKSGSSAMLECKRADSGGRAYVRVGRSDSGSGGSITLPWP